MSKLLIGKLKLKIEDFACSIVDHSEVITVLTITLFAFFSLLIMIDKPNTEFLYFKNSKLVGIVKYSEVKKRNDCLSVVDQGFICSDNSIYKRK